MANKKYNNDLLKTARENWNDVYVDALSEKDASIFKKRKKAVDMYIDGVKLRKIEKTTGIPHSKIGIYIGKCLAIDENGKEKGYSGLIPYNHVGRKSTMSANELSSNKGSLQSLFLRYPQIKNFIQDMYFGKNATLNKYITKKDLFEYFLTECKKQGIQDYEYPFNTSSKGIRSFYKYIDSLTLTNPDKAIFRESKDSIQKYYSTGKGEKKRQYPFVPYSVVQIDGHKIDMLYAIEIEKNGESFYMPATRMWLIAAIDVATRAILGYSLTANDNYSQTDVMKAIQDIIMPRRMKELHLRGLQYPENGGYPSLAIPEVSWAVPNVIMMDNAKAHLAQNVTSTLTEKLGCTLNYGPVGSPETRGIVERFFRTLEERGYHRMPSTTGSSINDVRRKDAEKNAVKYRITYNDIEELTEILIANYNNSIHSALNNESPLECMQRRLDAGMQPFILFDDKEKQYVKELSYIHDERIVRGSLSCGKRPYITYKKSEYRNIVLSQSPDLIGHKLHLVINPDDISYIRAYLETGEELGCLKATGEFGEKSHSLKTRTWANKLGNERKNQKLQSDYQPLFELEESLLERSATSRSSRTKLGIIKREQNDTPIIMGNEDTVKESSLKNINAEKNSVDSNEKKGFGQITEQDKEILRLLSEAGTIEEAIKRGLI